MSDVERRQWPRHPRYLIGSDGSVIGPRGPVAGTPIAGGYRLVSVRLPSGRRTSTTIHAMVCETFHGPRPAGTEAAHDNGIPSDNRASNLSWKVPARNVADRWRHGTDWHPQRRLVEQQVREILAASDVSASELADRYGVTASTIRHIRSGRTWHHLREVSP